jgi:hypothetical protein
MLISGIDELTINSIRYIKESLFLNVTEEEAALLFKSVIGKARSITTYRKFDNMAHLFNKRKK